jgi:hypothetical protein
MDESRRALLSGLIDYAGLFPPAQLDMAEAVRNFQRYRTGAQSWMLARFVVPEARAGEAPQDFPLSVISADKKRERAGDVEYLEIPLSGELPASPLRAKIRTGGLTPDAYPSAETLAGFLCRAAKARIAFKATAGLHHPLPSPPMHGFVNVFLAAALAWHGAGEAEVLGALADAEWAWHGLTAEQIRSARRGFAISFGSCSFEEPVEDLRGLGWL